MERESLERHVEVQAELAARIASDPWFQFGAHPKQKEFIASILDGLTQESWAICANRSGKTEGACYIGAALSRFGRQAPGFKGCGAPGPTKGWVISATSNASRSVVQPKYFDNGMTGGRAPFIPAREILNFNKNEQVLYLKNGSVIEFKSAEVKTISLAGAGLDWIHIDEEVDKAKYDELTIRVEAGKRLLIFGACTLLPPEGQVGGVSWLFPDKIKPWIERGGRELSYRLYGWSIYDNPYILRDEIARLESKYPVGSTERAIRLDGEWLPGLQGSRAYTAFDERLHVKPQGPIQIRKPLIWTWDFNVEPMASLVCQRDGDTYRVLKEFILETDASIDQMVDWFRNVIPSHHGEVWIYGDATGKHRNDGIPGGRSEFALILNLMRTYGSPVRLKVPDSNPLVTDRINAMNAALRDETGEIHIEIDPECKELVADLEQVLRDNKGGLKKSRDRKDPYFKRTHASDALGYLITYERPVRVTRSFGERLTSAIKNPGYFKRPS
jgi:hypothetical protein